MTDTIALPVDDLQLLNDSIAKAGPIVAKQASLEKALAAKGQELVDTLARSGLIHESLKEAALKEFKDDPAKLVESFTKFAQVAGPRAMGGPAADPAGSDAKSASEDFEQRVYARRR